MCGRLRVGKENLHVAALIGAACVRPICAVRKTAGHNAVRGSGPGQFHAFDHAVAQVGCPASGAYRRPAISKAALVPAAGGHSKTIIQATDFIL